MKLLLTLTLGIASCGIGWGELYYPTTFPSSGWNKVAAAAQDSWPKPPKSQKACVKPAFVWQDGKCYNNPNPCPDDVVCSDGPAILEQSSKPLPECTTEVTATAIVITSGNCVLHAPFCLGDCKQPVDLPAIMEDYIVIHAGTPGGCGGFSDCIIQSDVHSTRPGCIDKTRGLWHDEQTPPKFYCRKPQTGDHQ